MKNKKWYNPIDCTNANSFPFIADKADFHDASDWDFSLGIPVSVFDRNISFWTENDVNNGIPDDVLQHCAIGLPVYSHALRCALEAGAISGIQYLPVSVRRPDGTQVVGYSIANIINLVRALDTGRSLVTRYDKTRPDRVDEISGILKPVLIAKALGEYDIIRLAEFPLRYYVSQRFRNIFLRGNFSGYTFKEVLVV